MWQAVLLFGGMLLAIGIKVLMEAVKLSEEPYRSDAVGKPMNFANRATAECQSCGSKELRLYPDRWYICRGCRFAGQLER